MGTVRPRDARGLAVATVLVAAVAASVITPPAMADTIAIVSDGTASQATLDGGDAFVQVADGVAGVAYDRDGRLWLAHPGEGEFDSCSIGPADGATPDFAPAPLRRQMLQRTAVGGVDCDLTTDPRGGLLFGGSNGTLASASTWHLDTATGAVALVSWGYSAASSADGSRIAVIRHIYRHPTGADERLSLGTLGVPSSTRPASWARSGWAAPSFAPDGRLAAARWTPRGDQLLVGAGGPPWRVVWKPGRAISIASTAWSSAGDLLVLAYRGSAGQGNLYRFVGGHPPGQLYSSGVTDFALGPDLTSPPALPQASQ